MALNNLISKFQPVVNSQGKPIAGGSVYIYEPGTTTFIKSYMDSGLVSENEQPVPLSGSGRAEVWITRDCDIRIEDRNGNLIVTADNANPDSFGDGESSGLVPNGSFEIDSNVDDIPDGWTLTSETGSDNEIDSTESTDGANCFRFTSTGNGGGSLTTTDFFPVNEVSPLRVSFDIRSTVAGVNNIVRVEWYDVSQVSISNTDVYDSVSNPTTFTNNLLDATPPANARYAKLKLIGIDPGVAISGSTYFDRVAVFYNLNQEIAFTRETAVATTGAASFDFTDIPSGVKKITVAFDQVSTDGTSSILISIGDSGGIENANYDHHVTYVSGSSTVNNSGNSTGFLVAFPAIATSEYNGLLTMYNITGNVWVASWQFTNNEGTLQNFFGAGRKELSAELDRVRIEVDSGLDDFDGGSVNIFYE